MALVTQRLEVKFTIVYQRLQLSYTGYLYFLFQNYFQGLFQAKTESDFRTLPSMNNYKEAINIGGGQIRSALLNFFVVKKCPFLYLSDAALSF